MPSKIIPVQGYKTTDDQVHLDEDAAVSHQARIDLQAIVERIDWPRLAPWEKNKWVDWLIENAREIERIQRLLEVI